MKPHYLEHLARRGLADIHPLGADASAALLAALQLDHRQRVLEIGCGTGRSLVRVALAGGQLVAGIDILPAMLAVARRRIARSAPGAPIVLLEGTATGLPFAPAAFTQVYTESALGFQDETTARCMLAEIMRVLSPGGRYVANEAVWRRGVSAREARHIYESCQADFGLCQASLQPWNVDDWCAAMGDAGFRVVAADRLAERLTNQPQAVSVDEPAGAGSLPLSDSWRSLMHPRLIWERLHYRRLLARHKDDGLAMESYLFILEKR